MIRILIKKLINILLYLVFLICWYIKEVLSYKKIQGKIHKDLLVLLWIEENFELKTWGYRENK